MYGEHAKKLELEATRLGRLLELDQGKGPFGELREDLAQLHRALDRDENRQAAEAYAMIVEKIEGEVAKLGAELADVRGDLRNVATLIRRLSRGKTPRTR